MRDEDRRSEDRTTSTEGMKYRHRGEWRTFKPSSLSTDRQGYERFKRDFEGKRLSEVTRRDAIRWAEDQADVYVKSIRALFEQAIDEELIERNPFRKLSGSTPGRAHLDPPTVEEMEALREACSALGKYGEQVRDLIDFAAETLMRPSELYELRWPDIDFAHGEIHKDRRLYRGLIDTPKTGKKTIPLSPTARAILLRQKTRGREDGLVFVSKTGRQLTSNGFSPYWTAVKAAAGRKPGKEDPGGGLLLQHKAPRHVSAGQGRGIGLRNR